MPKKYELIHPPTVEAEEVTQFNLNAVAKWCSGTAFKSTNEIEVFVSRGERIRMARVGQYIVKSGAGDFSVMEPEAFKAKYKEKIDGE